MYKARIKILVKALGIEKFKELEDSKHNPENESFFKKAKSFWSNLN